MKAKIYDEFFFGGLYTDDFVLDNPQLFENCQITDILPPKGLIKPFWKNNYWEESVSEEEIQIFKKSLIPKTVSQRQLRTQLVFNGFDLNSVQLAINSLPEPNKSIAQISWDYAVIFERKDDLLIALSEVMGISDSQLDEIFINASKI